MAALAALMAVMVLMDTVKLNITRAVQDKVQPQNPLAKSEEHSTLAVAVVELALERELAQLVAQAEAAQVEMAPAKLNPEPQARQTPAVAEEEARIIPVRLLKLALAAQVSSSSVGTTQYKGGTLWHF